MIEDILKGVQLEEVDEGIFSCLGKTAGPISYDNTVNAYDLLVGNRFYNRMVWGNWPSHYREFCQQALESTPAGIYLDAGCGSLVFTASAYSEANNKLIVLLDRSLGMLAKGRDRIKKIRGAIPNNIVFIQADIFCLPFQDQVFDTVACFGVLHIFDNKLSLLGELERVKLHRGHVLFSSLAGNNTIGRKYLEMLRQAGEVASVHSSQSLAALLSRLPFKYTIYTIGNMVYGMSAKQAAPANAPTSRR